MSEALKGALIIGQSGGPSSVINSSAYGLSQSKVKSILFRSRNQLREYLGKEGYDL